MKHSMISKHKKWSYCNIAVLGGMVLIFLFSTVAKVHAQGRGGIGRAAQGIGSRVGGSGGSGGGSDSLSFEKRKFADDSVNVRFKYLDTARYSFFDSSVSDFYKRIPMKPEYIQIGHNGNAIRSLLFSPLRSPGWDMGFHAFDPYALTIADTRFMNTTKPFTELGYLVGSKAEQQISILHTQNVSPDWNFVIQYRLINAPGTFNSQNTNHNNFRFNTDFTSKNQRYHAYLILMSNALQSAENGGIQDESYLVNPNPAYEDRFNIPTNLAATAFSSRNFFNVKLITGNRYVDKHYLLRQQYDFGKKDSIKTDSSVVRFFLPKLRFENTVQLSKYNYEFLDVQASGSEEFYKNNYLLNTVPDTVNYQTGLDILKTDFSLIQFPDSKNPLQFIKAGASFLLYTPSTGLNDNRFTNTIVHGEYRNRTRNKKWDMLLYGEFFVLGRDLGNYRLKANLQRSLGEKIGSIELGFENINRTPSDVFTRNLSFPVLRQDDLGNENITAINASLNISKIKTRLSLEYFLISNYTYFKGFREADQYAPLFNFIRVGMNKETNITRRWKWYLDLYVQTATGNAPIHLPLIYTRNRVAYEGKPFRNLVISSGLDFRYYSPYYADNYSPLIGQFFYQSERKIAIRPDVAAYTNFRIRSFTTYVRIENLNTITQRYGFGFKDNNLAAPLYPNPGMVFRLGIFWNFVN
ncbi:MAG: hypothetical protein RLZZ204_1006 [Bacteroidota bacterium]